MTQEEPRRLMSSAVDYDFAPVFSLAFIASSTAVTYSKSSASAFSANLYSFSAATRPAFEGLTMNGRMKGFAGGAEGLFSEALTSKGGEGVFGGATRYCRGTPGKKGNKNSPPAPGGSLLKP